MQRIVCTNLRTAQLFKRSECSNPHAMYQRSRTNPLARGSEPNKRATPGSPMVQGGDAHEGILMRDDQFAMRGKVRQKDRENLTACGRFLATLGSDEVLGGRVQGLGNRLQRDPMLWATDQEREKTMREESHNGEKGPPFERGFHPLIDDDAWHPAATCMFDERRQHVSGGLLQAL